MTSVGAPAPTRKSTRRSSSSSRRLAPLPTPPPLVRGRGGTPPPAPPPSPPYHCYNDQLKEYAGVCDNHSGDRDACTHGVEWYMHSLWVCHFIVYDNMKCERGFMLRKGSRAGGAAPERGATQQPKASILLSLRWPTGNAAEIYQHEHFIAARTWRPVCSP